MSLFSKESENKLYTLLEKSKTNQDIKNDVHEFLNCIYNDISNNFRQLD